MIRKTLKNHPENHSKSVPSRILHIAISGENPRWLWEIAEHNFLWPPRGPKRRSRGDQEATKTAQEGPKTTSRRPKIAPRRAKTEPRRYQKRSKTTQDASRRFQNGSRRLKRVPKRLKTPQRRPKTVPRLPKTVKSSKSCFFVCFFCRRMQFRLGKSEVCGFYDYKKHNKNNLNKYLIFRTCHFYRGETAIRKV